MPITIWNVFKMCGKLSDGWDDRERKKQSSADKALTTFSIKLSTAIVRLVPRRMVKYTHKITEFTHKYGLRLSVRQFWLSLFLIHSFVWIFLPFLVNDNPWLMFVIRMPILIGVIFLYFTVDRDDDDGDDDNTDPPKDDGGIVISNTQNMEDNVK